MASKKKGRKAGGKAKGQLISTAQLKDWLDLAERQTVEGDYASAAATARRILRYVPRGGEVYVEAQERLGTAAAMLQQFDVAYEAFSRAVEASPNSSHLWYNRGLASRFTMRFGQALRDMERALAVDDRPALRQRLEEELAVSRKMVESELALRGPDFTVEQLIEQQELYQRGMQMMTDRRWTEAEATFRQVIAMADRQPQPWLSLGGALIMQKRFDEGEAALRRALEIDPNYDLARKLFQDLPAIRAKGSPPELEFRHPLDGAKIRSSILPIKDR